MGDLYWHLKESVAKYELVLLRALQFNMHRQLPHPVSKYIEYCGLVKGWLERPEILYLCIILETIILSKIPHTLSHTERVF